MVELRLNCNLHDTTIEEVTSKMKKTHSDLVQTIRAGLLKAGFEDLRSFDAEIDAYTALDGQWCVFGWQLSRDYQRCTYCKKKSVRGQIPISSGSSSELRNRGTRGLFKNSG